MSFLICTALLPWFLLWQLFHPWSALINTVSISLPVQSFLCLQCFKKRIMVYCFLHHAEEKEMLIAEAGTVTSVLFYNLSCFASCLQTWIFSCFEKYFLFLLIFKNYDVHSSSFLFPLLIMLKQTLFKLNSIAFTT